MGKPCPLGFRCHVEGAGITKFGTKFSPDMVLRLASSSVQLINKNLSRRFATATLIWPNVILCDAHSLQGPFLLSDLELLLFHECDAKTAPAAHARFATCTTLATTPQAKLYKELESGYGFGLDYSLIAIEWTSFTVVPSSGGSASKQVKFPRAVVLPKPGYQYGGELLAIGHPSGSGGQSEPTQAAPGRLVSSGDPHPSAADFPAGATSKEYSYADFGTHPGMSGGGVFNDQGHMVGLVTGMRTLYTPTGASDRQDGFLNLGLVAGKVVNGGTARPASKRIRRWLGGGSPLLPGDPQPDPAVSFDPPF